MQVLPRMAHVAWVTHCARQGRQQPRSQVLPTAGGGWQPTRAACRLYVGEGLTELTSWHKPLSSGTKPSAQALHTSSEVPGTHADPLARHVDWASHCKKQAGHQHTEGQRTGRLES
jgi:hypothetical protein